MTAIDYMPDPLVVPVTFTVKAGAYEGTATVEGLPSHVGSLLAVTFGKALTERVRQIADKGMSPERDREYTKGQLATAGIAYLQAANAINEIGHDCEAPSPEQVGVDWPDGWDWAMFKPFDSDQSSRVADQLRCLEKAAALILAEHMRVSAEAADEAACAADERRAEGR
ncbi:hypothetical protein W2_gp052 [Caulobacter phage W2]|uniref:Uncharacterized protein n=1 Tax=Caulobacter phage TMCBR4 TaxID=3028191 RepID=A0AAF0CIU7_9CAUD|nr:hypothetical protein TMCBR4_gp053 [Caulobacter phage TMCBR4]WDS38420.1 hypothetical protein W2_gp052 [Caulobacter phage W2]